MTPLKLFTAVFRRFRSLVLGREVEVTGHCNLCGRCCRDILMLDGDRWLKDEDDFYKLIHEAPENDRFYISGRNQKGYLLFTCSLIGEDNICPCHDQRPGLCRNYPSKALYYDGGWILSDCGYSFRHVTFRDVLTGRRRLRPRRFAKVLSCEIEREGDGKT